MKVLKAIFFPNVYTPHTFTHTLLISMGSDDRPNGCLLHVTNYILFYHQWFLSIPPSQGWRERALACLRLGQNKIPIPCEGYPSALTARLWSKYSNVPVQHTLVESLVWCCLTASNLFPLIIHLSFVPLPCLIWVSPPCSLSHALCTSCPIHAFSHASSSMEISFSFLLKICVPPSFLLYLWVT